MPVNIRSIKPGDLLVYTSGRQSDVGSIVQVVRVTSDGSADDMIEVKWVKPASKCHRIPGTRNTLYAWRFEPYFGTHDEKLSPVERKIRTMAARYESRRQYAGIN